MKIQVKISLGFWLAVLFFVLPSNCLDESTDGQEIPIVHQVVQWMLVKTHEIVRQADSIAEQASEQTTFNPVNCLKFMELVNQLKPLAQDMNIQEFDWLRRKLKSYEIVGKELGRIFKQWLIERVKALVAQEKSDIDKNSKLENLAPSSKWTKIFKEIEFFVENSSDKSLIKDGLDLLENLSNGRIYTLMSYYRDDIIEKNRATTLMIQN